MDRRAHVHAITQKLALTLSIDHGRLPSVHKSKHKKKKRVVFFLFFLSILFFLFLALSLSFLLFSSFLFSLLPLFLRSFLVATKHCGKNRSTNRAANLEAFECDLAHGRCTAVGSLPPPFPPSPPQKKTTELLITGIFPARELVFITVLN